MKIELGQQKAFKDLPRNDNDKVHDVPCVSQVTAAMKNKAQGQNFQGRLNSKNAQEIGLRGFLEKRAQKIYLLKEAFKTTIFNKYVFVGHICGE